MMSNHGTVSVLFQVKPDNPPTKPAKSSIGLQQPLESTTLACQNIRPYIRGKKELIVPNSFSVDKDVLASPDVAKSDEDLNFILSYIRSNAISSDHDSINPTWAGCYSLLPIKSASIMQVGFLTYLRNFLAVLVQLAQESLPGFCDEGIILKHPQEFKNLIPDSPLY